MVKNMNRQDLLRIFDKVRMGYYHFDKKQIPIILTQREINSLEELLKEALFEREQDYYD